MKTDNSTVLIDSADDVGCPVRYHWCRTSPRIWLPQFILGAVLHATGLSFCVTLLISLYSKVLVNRNQVSFTKTFHLSYYLKFLFAWVYIRYRSFYKISAKSFVI